MEIYIHAAIAIGLSILLGRGYGATYQENGKAVTGILYVIFGLTATILCIFTIAYATKHMWLLLN